jgi:DNA topoisomerase-1
MRILRARKSGKRFAGCGGYPECRVTFPLPQKGAVVSTGVSCEECGSPRIKVLSKGSRPWELCLDPACPTKAQSSSGRQGETASEQEQDIE